MTGQRQLIGKIVSISGLGEGVPPEFSAIRLVLYGSDGRGEIEIHLTREQSRGYAPGDEFVVKLDMSGVR